ncbi:MAG TPA: rhomboid family intramembrane serine protease [Pirellulaceae bacterium]|nr:rhomboid family intramembrane serine protease [Pirellulaceae bacterium]
MGYQERDYYREGTGEEGFQIKSWTVRLILINVAVFLANLLTSTSGHKDWLNHLLSLQGNAIVEPTMWYQFLTYGFVHNPLSLWHIVGNMIGLYIFGTIFEERFGGRELLRVFLVAIVLGGIVWSLRHSTVTGQFRGAIDEQLHWFTCQGASGGVATLILIGCLLQPHKTILLFFAIRTPIWVVGALLLVSDLTGAWAAENIPGDFAWKSIAFDVHLTGAAIGLAYWGLGLNFGRMPGGRELATGWSKLKSLFRSRPSMRIHKELDEDEEEDLEVQADRLLAKIARQGEASLTPQERRILETYSRRIRDRQR